MNKLRDTQAKLQKKSPQQIPLTSAIFFGVLAVLVAFTAGTRTDLQSLLNNNPLRSENSSLPEDLDYTTVEHLYDELRANFDGTLTEQALLDGLKSGLVEASGDKYTVYLTEEQAKQFDSELNGTFSGIGAELGTEEGKLVIMSPMEGFPAQKAGVRAKDVIIAINDEDASGLSVEEAVLKIRGEEGTKVKLTVLRGDERLDFEIERKTITVPSVTHEILDGNIGYLRISRFADDTSQLAEAAAQDFKSKNVSSVILDLRNNSGGYLTSAVDVAGLWIENQTIVDQRENDGKDVTDTLKSGSTAPLKGIKTALLINGGSASASEIVAGALQDYKAATLIGETSFGKGSVQNLEQLKDGGVLKVTIARWYTPNGRNIDKEGIKPDIEEKYNEKADDNQKDRALKFLKNNE